MMWLSTNLFL